MYYFSLIDLCRCCLSFAKWTQTYFQDSFTNYFVLFFENFLFANFEFYPEFQIRNILPGRSRYFGYGSKIKFQSWKFIKNAFDDRISELRKVCGIREGFCFCNLADPNPCLYHYLCIWGENWKEIKRRGRIKWKDILW